MAKSPKSGSGKKTSDSDISSVEEETLKRVNKTMKSIEEFLARWDAAKAKPEEMVPQVARIKEFHRTLSEWQRKAVMGKGRGSHAERMKRLEDFVLICRTYS